jgi:hypothetical protein
MDLTKFTTEKITDEQLIDIISWECVDVWENAPKNGRHEWVTMWDGKLILCQNEDEWQHGDEWGRTETEFFLLTPIENECL